MPTANAVGIIYASVVVTGSIMCFLMTGYAQYTEIKLIKAKKNNAGIKIKNPRLNCSPIKASAPHKARQSKMPIPAIKLRLMPSAVKIKAFLSILYSVMLNVTIIKYRYILMKRYTMISAVTAKNIKYDQ